MLIISMAAVGWGSFTAIFVLNINFFDRRNHHSAERLVLLKLVRPIELLLAFFAFEQLHAQVASLMIFAVSVSNELFTAERTGECFFPSMSSHMLEEAALMLENFRTPIEDAHHLSLT